MIDRLFSAVLTFCILAGGTVAIGSAMLDYDAQAARQAARQAAAQHDVVQLPAVEITVKRSVLAESERNAPRVNAVQ
jgi:Flp pilus assembly protein TadG